jgi:hypothetical protein
MTDSKPEKESKSESALARVSVGQVGGEVQSLIHSDVGVGGKRLAKWRKQKIECGSKGLYVLTRRTFAGFQSLFTQKNTAS